VSFSSRLPGWLGWVAQPRAFAGPACSAAANLNRPRGALTYDVFNSTDINNEGVQDGAADSEKSQTSDKFSADGASGATSAANDVKSQ
jgi:hypothetical protein